MGPHKGTAYYSRYLNLLIHFDRRFEEQVACNLGDHWSENKNLKCIQRRLEIWITSISQRVLDRTLTSLANASSCQPTISYATSQTSSGITKWVSDAFRSLEGDLGNTCLQRRIQAPLHRELVTTTRIIKILLYMQFFQWSPLEVSQIYRGCHKSRQSLEQNFSSGSARKKSLKSKD